MDVFNIKLEPENMERFGFLDGCEWIKKQGGCLQCAAVKCLEATADNDNSYHKGIIMACHTILQNPHECRPAISDGDMNAFLNGKLVKVSCYVAQKQ